MIFGLILSFLGLLLGLTKKSLVPFFYILWITIFPYIIDLIIPFGEIEKLYEMRVYANYYLFFMFFVLLFQKNNIIQFIEINKYVVFIIFLAIIYLIILGFQRGCALNYLTYFRKNYSPLFLFLYLSLCTPKLSYINHFVKFLLTSQLIIGTFQLFNLGQYSFNIGTIVGVNYLTGTMTGNNLYADLLAVIISIFIIEFFSGREQTLIKSRHLVVVGIMYSLFLIFRSGIRTPLLSIIIVLPIILLKFRRKQMLPLFITVISIATLGGFLNVLTSKNEVVYDWKVTNSSERQSSALLGILGGWEYLQYTTLSISYTLINDYFIYSPLLGSGLFYTPNGYGVISSTSNNDTDAVLALIFTEYGIVGAFLFASIFVVLFKSQQKFIGNQFFKIGFVVIVLLLQTLTDSGIFDGPGISFLFLYVFYLKLSYSPNTNNNYESNHLRH